MHIAVNQNQEDSYRIKGHIENHMKAVGNHMQAIHFLGIWILLAGTKRMHGLSGKEKKAVHKSDQHTKGPGNVGHGDKVSLSHIACKVRNTS